MKLPNEPLYNIGDLIILEDKKKIKQIINIQEIEGRNAFSNSFLIKNYYYFLMEINKNETVTKVNERRLYDAIQRKKAKIQRVKKNPC